MTARERDEARATFLHGVAGVALAIAVPVFLAWLFN